MIRYENVPAIIATLTSARLATLHELQTVYGPQDAYNMLEIHMIDQFNSRVLHGNGN